MSAQDIMYVARLEAENKRLREEIDGYEGCCWACEPVGMLNKELEARVAELEATAAYVPAGELVRSAFLEGLHTGAKWGLGMNEERDWHESNTKGELQALLDRHGKPEAGEDV